MTNIVKYLSDLAKKKNIIEKQLWLDPIPGEIYVKNLRKKYNISSTKNIINPIIGEYDDPFNQLQDILTLNLSEEGNTCIYGRSDSGKELILQSIIYDSMVSHSTEEVQFYLLDFGSEILRNFANCPHVGDIILSDDSEKVLRLFKLIKFELRERKQKLIEYNGDYSLYIKNSNQSMPMIIVIINEFGNFIQAYPNMEEELINITKECVKYGMAFVITANAVNEVRAKIVQNFRKKLALQLIGDDYAYVFNKARKKKPSNIYGRGLITVQDDNVYEFQSARICNLENINEFTKKLAVKLNKINKVKALPIPVVPSLVTIKSVKQSLKDLSTVPVGISTKNIKPYTYNFEENIVNIITTKDLEIIKQFIVNLIKEIKLLKSVEVILVDEEEVIMQNNDSFVERFNSITERLNKNLAQKEEKKLLYIIIGVDKFLNNLGTEKELFTMNVNSAKMCNNCNFILIDVASKIKSHQFDSWYKQYVVAGTGIYIGNGFDSQFAIAYEADRKDIKTKCGNSFGYVVKRSKPQLVKLLGLEEKGEEDE